MTRFVLIFVLFVSGCATQKRAPSLDLPSQVASDPNWKEYQGYLKGLIEKVQAQWERFLVESRTYPPEGSKVVVVFIINAKGEISKIKEVKNASSEAGAKMCVSAITIPSPYGVWTDAMKVSLGEEQEMTFTFEYR